MMIFATFFWTMLAAGDTTRILTRIEKQNERQKSEVVMLQTKIDNLALSLERLRPETSEHDGDENGQ